MTTLKVLKEKENSLLKRKEIVAFIHSEKSPSREEISKLLSEKFSIPKANIKIKKILGSFGSKDFNIEANLYNSIEAKDSVELKKKKEKEAEKVVVEAAAV